MKRKKKSGKRVYIGIDNGVSGSIGWVNPEGDCGFHHAPIFKTLSYQKKEKKINRIDTTKLYQLLQSIIVNYSVPMAFIERPMVNPGRFTATLSAIRALEATLIVLEDLELAYQYIDSREWQKAMLPKGVKGSDKLKLASLDIATRLFPQFSSQFKKDADGILIAEWAKRSQL